MYACVYCIICLLWRYCIHLWFIFFCHWYICYFSRFYKGFIHHVALTASFYCLSVFNSMIFIYIDTTGKYVLANQIKLFCFLFVATTHASNCITKFILPFVHDPLTTSSYYHFRKLIYTVFLVLYLYWCLLQNSIFNYTIRL